MRRWHKGLLPYLLFGATAIVVVLFFQNRSLDAEQHNQRVDILLNLRQSEAELDKLVLLTTFFRLSQYDAFISEVHRLKGLFDDSAASADQLGGMIGESYRKDLGSYRLAMDQKLDQLEAIKSKTALVRNGLHYMTLLVSEFGGEDLQRHLVQGLLNDLFHYNLFPTEQNLHQVQGRLEEVVAARGDDASAPIGHVIFHMKANLRLINELSQLRDGYTAIISTERFHQLYQNYGRNYARHSKRSDVYSLLLLLLAVVLFIGLGVALRRMAVAQESAERSWSQLHNGVESLSEAFALFDQQGHLVIHNARYRLYYPWLSDLLDKGTCWDEIQQLNAASAHLTALPTGEGELKDIKTEDAVSYMEQCDDGRWLMAGDARTPQGDVVCVRMDITASKRSEQELIKLNRALEQTPLSVVITNTDGVIEYVNPYFETVTGYSREEAMGKNPRILKSGEMREAEYRLMWKSIATGQIWRGIFHNRRKNGELYWESASISPVRTPEGIITHYIAVKEDITAKKQVEDQLRMSGKVFDTADEGILVTDRDGVIQAVNPSFTRITGFNADESIGQEPGALLASGRHDSDYYQLMWYELVQKGRWSGEIWNRRKDGSLFPEWLSIAVVRNDEGEISGYVGVFSDITQRKKDEAQIRYQANYDTLTRLPNRTLLEERLNRALATARRDGRKVVLLFVDLDRFKHINDILGHTVGDELLQLVSRELQRCAKREVDTVARFGGDEFVILMEDVGQVDDAADIAERVVAALAKPFRLEGRELSVGASIGISIYPDDSGDAGALLRNADMAMYRAKELGRNNYQFFTSQMNEQVSARMELEQGLRHALNKGQFYLCYQPIVEGITGRLAAVEALLRWRHSELGLVSPVDFIPLAEETGAIVPIGLWVLQTACEQTAAWRQQGLEISVSVNVSGRQLANLDAGIVRQVLSNSGLPPAALKLEMTESLLIESEEALAWVDSMRALGVGLSLDDFGTGYSSLSYLKRFHMDILKVDRSFVSGLPGDMDDASLVKAILAMAGSLGLKVVAEGVETVEQYNCLKALGCDYIQGFLFSKPIEAGQIAEFAMKNSLDFSDNC